MKIKCPTCGNEKEAWTDKEDAFRRGWDLDAYNQSCFCCGHVGGCRHKIDNAEVLPADDPDRVRIGYKVTEHNGTEQIVNVIPADKPERIPLGWKVFECRMCFERSQKGLELDPECPGCKDPFGSGMVVLGKRKSEE